MGDQFQNEDNHKPIAGTPRWIKIFGISAIALVVLIVIIMIVSGGNHGPGRHMPSREQGGQQ